MSDDTSSLDILIRTLADTAGAERVQAALDQAKGSIRQSGKAHEEAGKAAEKHGAGLHALHKLFHGLNEVVPGLGTVMQAAFSPMGAAISVAVMALQLFREHMKKLSEEFEKFETEAAKPLTNRLEIMRDAVIRNSESLAEYRNRLAEASRSHRTLADDVEEVVSAMRKESQLLGTLAETGANAQLTVLETLHKKGLESEEEYARLRLVIERKLADEKRKIAENELQAEINIRKQGVEAAKKDQPALDAASGKAREKTVTTETESLVAKSGMETAKENAKTAAEALKVFEKKHPEWSEWFEGFGVNAKPADVSAKLGTRENLSAFQASGGFHGMFGGPGLSEAYTEWARLKTGANAADAAKLAAPGDVAKKETAATEATEAYHVAIERAAKNREFVTKGQEETAMKERELGARKEADAAISKADRDAGRLKTPLGEAATADVKWAAETARKLSDTPQKYQQEHVGTSLVDALLAVQREHAEPSQADKQRLVEIGTRISGHKESLSSAVDLLAKAATNSATMTNDVMKLVTTMETIVRFFSQFPNFQGRLDSIAAQVRALEKNPTTKTHPGEG